MAELYMDTWVYKECNKSKLCMPNVSYTCLIPALIRSGRKTDAKTGPEIREQLNMQAFGHDISELVCRGNMKNSNMSQTDLLTDEVDVDPDVLGAAMMDRIGHHVDSANIVAIDNHRSSNRDMRLLKKLTKPTTLGNSMGVAKMDSHVIFQYNVLVIIDNTTKASKMNCKNMKLIPI